MDGTVSRLSSVEYSGRRAGDADGEGNCVKDSAPSEIDRII